MIPDTVTVSEAVLEALQAMEFTQGMEPRHIVILASIGAEQMFDEGDIIFHEGDKSDLLYLVQEGRVALYIRVPGRGNVTILSIEPGRLLGWSSLFPPHHKTAGARAMVSTRVIALNAPHLLQLCRRDPKLGYAVMQRVAEAITSRLVATRLQLLGIFAPAAGETGQYLTLNGLISD